MGSWDVTYLGSRERATDTRTYSFERPEGLDYRPGQFFFVTLPPAPGVPAEKTTHHFSFSSSPTEPVVEFTTRLTGSPFKLRLTTLEAGERVSVTGPDGAFVLPPETAKATFLCGGIGITPVRSTVRWALDTRAGVDILVIRADRDLASAAFREELEALAAPPVRVVQVLSDPLPGWTGRTGHIDASLVLAESPDWRERRFFVSGPPGMVTTLARVLEQEVGVPQELLVAEAFPGYA